MVYQRKAWFNKEKPGITIAKPGLTGKPGITISKPGFTEQLVISQVKRDKPGFTKLFVSSNLGCKPNAHQVRLKQVKKYFRAKPRFAMQNLVLKLQYLVLLIKQSILEQNQVLHFL